MKNKLRTGVASVAVVFASVAGVAGVASAATHHKSNSNPSCVVTKNIANDAFGNNISKQYDFKDGLLIFESPGSIGYNANASTPDTITAVPISQLSSQGQALAAQIQKTLPKVCQAPVPKKTVPAPAPAPAA